MTRERKNPQALMEKPRKDRTRRGVGTGVRATRGREKKKRIHSVHFTGKNPTAQAGLNMI